MLAETARILGLASNSQPLPSLPDWAEGLRPVQRQALAEMTRAQGLLGIIGCGQGKALISFLAPTVIPCARPVLLVPAGVRAQTLRELARWRERYPIHNDITVMTYNDLSTAKGWALFLGIDPDLVVADEAHHLRHPVAARTRRLLGWFRAHPLCRFVGLSGTMAARSLREVSHLAELALREGSPLPRDWHVLEAWCAHVDHGAEPPTPQQAATWAPVARQWPAASPRDTVREVLSSAPGCVLTTDSSAAECSLSIRVVRLRGSEPMEAARRVLLDRWELPDGEALLRASEVAAARRAIASGYYMHHEWRAPAYAGWVATRQRWALALQDVLARRLPGIDSPAQAEEWVRQHTDRGELGTDRGELGTDRGERRSARMVARSWAAALEEWEAVASDLDTQGEPRWLCQSWARRLAAMAWDLEAERGPALVWCESQALRLELGRQGLDVPALGDAPAPHRSAVLSRRSHGVGLNLQAWATCLVAEVPTSADAWEQMIARVHRLGQLANDVLFVVPYWDQYTVQTLERVRQQAEFIETTTGQRQKINLASIDHETKGSDHGSL